MPKVARRPDSVYWFAWITDPRTGKRKRVSTHETNKRLAQAVADARELGVHNPRPQAAPSVTLARAIADFLEQRAALKAPATLDFYTKKCGVLVGFFGEDLPLDRITASAVDRFTAARLAERVKKSTIGKELTALRQVLKLARRQGNYPHELDRVMPERWEGASTPKKRWVTEDEAWAIIKALPPHRGAVVAFHVATGSNLGEAMRAQREDVSADRSQVHLRGTKRKTRDRVVPVFSWGTPFLKFALDNASSKKRGEPMFLDWYKAMRWDLKRVCDKLEIDGVSSNDLRRTYAQWLRQRGVEPALIGVAMGHKDSRMVEQVYGVIPPDKLRPLIERQLEGVRK